MRSQIPHPPTEEFLEPADCARVLGVTPGRVQQMDAQGVLVPAARTVRGGRLYRLEDVEQLAAERRQRREQSRALEDASDTRRAGPPIDR